MTEQPHSRNLVLKNVTGTGAIRSLTVRALAVSILAYVIAVAAIEFTRGAGQIATIWPINAILIALLLKSHRSNWLSLLVATGMGLFAANLTSGNDIPRSAILTLANLAEICCVLYVFERVPSVRFFSLPGISVLVAGATIGCAISAGLAAIGLLVTGEAFVLREALNWFSADFLGILLFAPITWSLLERSSKYGTSAPDFQYVAKLGLLCATTFFVFAQSAYPFLFLVPPALVFLAFSRGVKAAAVGLLMITAIALPFTLAGSGPLALMTGDMIAQILALQLFLATNSVLGLAIGAAASDRRRLMRQIRKSRARLRDKSREQQEMLAKAHLAERMAGVGHWTLNPVTQEVAWSPEVYAIHGVTPEEFNPMYGDAILFYAKEDRDRIRDLVQHAITDAQGWEFEATLIRKSDGQKRRVRSIGEILTDREGNVERIFGVFKDITDEQRVIEALASSEANYRTIADNSTDIIVRFGLDGIITYASPSCEILGVTSETAIGLSTIDFTIPEDKDFASSVTRDLFENNSVDPSVLREFRVRDKDGNIIWLEGNPKIIRSSDGKPVEIISTFRDITDRKERETALAEARAEAEAAEKAKAEFLSNMSHEIRTPLNGILGFTQLLSQTDLNAEQKLFAQRALSAGGMLRDIVNDILDYSKIEAGRVVLEDRPVDVANTIQETIEIVLAGREGKTVPITTSAGTIALYTDEVRLKQILTNLLSNAAKFTESGSIHISAHVLEDALNLTVTDTGPGIPAEKLESVFEGFRQADNSITRVYGGTGLGLSISRSLARLMGGELTLDSTVGEGTSATLILPYRPASQDEVSGRATRASPGQTKQMRIMAVDDVRMNLELVKLGLKKFGHTVEVFQSAQEAIEDLRAGGNYDVILMDVQMPELDGMTATRMIRELDEPARNIPIIALTANVMPEQISNCLAAGMNAHVAKPIDITELNSRIAELCDATARASAPEPETDPIGALTDRYREYLSTVPDEVSKIFDIENSEDVLREIRQLAHSIAGSAGSFGFKEVSDAAFSLESVASKLAEDGKPTQELAAGLKSFLQATERAAS